MVWLVGPLLHHMSYRFTRVLSRPRTMVISQLIGNILEFISEFIVKILDSLKCSCSALQSLMECLLKRRHSRFLLLGLFIFLRLRCWFIIVHTFQNSIVNKLLLLLLPLAHSPLPLLPLPRLLVLPGSLSNSLTVSITR